MGGAPNDVRQAYDFYSPMENLHEHSDIINGQEETYFAPMPDQGKTIF